jgi:predicted ATPase
MFTAIRVRNFKSYKDSGTLPLKPLTLILGANNAGKSSLLHSILLLAQTVEDRVSTQPLVTSGAFVDLGGFLDLVRGGQHASKRTFIFDLSVTEETARRGTLFAPEDRAVPTSMSVAFAFDEKANQIRVSSLKMRGDDREIVSARRSGRGYVSDLLSKKERADSKIFFRHFFPFIAQTRARPEQRFDFGDTSFIFQNGQYIWSSILSAVSHVAPLRTAVPRFGILGKTPSGELGPGGENLLRVLREAGAKHHPSDLVKEVSDWVSNRLHLLAKLRLVDVDTSGTVLSLLGDENEGFESINVANMGEGISQLLPIIVMVLTTAPDACLLIEQPEIHLHPAAQADLADLFVENARAGSRQYIVETHSEHMLLRLRRRIAEGRISPDRVAILYVERKRDGSVVRSLDLDDRGLFEDWPEGFFDERYQESLKIAEASSL